MTRKGSGVQLPYGPPNKCWSEESILHNISGLPASHFSDEHSERRRSEHIADVDGHRWTPMDLGSAVEHRVHGVDCALGGRQNVMPVDALGGRCRRVAHHVRDKFDGNARSGK